ncbi:MAG: TolC family protein [Pirellulaceae bacterium]
MSNERAHGGGRGIALRAACFLALACFCTCQALAQEPAKPRHLEEGGHQHQQSEAIPPPVYVVPEPNGHRRTLAIEDIEGMALANNPTLVQATAQVRAASGGAYQAGLFPNPVLGYTSDQIGIKGTAGELQGGFVSQEIVTGGKLRLSRAKWAQRAQIAETNLNAQQYRVINDVRAQFYRTLAAHRILDIRRQLAANGQDNVQTHREMLNLGQTTASAVLQAEVELQRDQLNLKDANNELQHAWRALVALAGVPELAQVPLAGTLETDEQPLDWDAALHQLLCNSPELAAARQKIRHDEIMVQRERAEPIPNILANVSVGRNFETGDTVTAVTAGIPLPVFDRNRGTVQQAQADLARSHAEVRRLELELQTRLADVYRRYLSARQRVEDYQATMLPKSQRAYELLKQSYEQRRAAWVDVLAAQRLYSMVSAEQIDNLTTYRETDIAVRGMLLSGGLIEPSGPISGGHIDATPKPR